MKTLLEAIDERHSVRSYKDEPLSQEDIDILNKDIDTYNQEGNMHIQLITNEPKTFSNILAHYGKFNNVKNYFALIGPDNDKLNEAAGYYGEHLVLKAQAMGLNTCWVALTFSKGQAKKVCSINDGERISCVIALGYGTSQGTAHTSKHIEDVSLVKGDVPDWYQAGIEAVMKAPTAMNQQKFTITMDGDNPIAHSTGGFYSDIDLGIIEYHFEAGSGHIIYHQ